MSKNFEELLKALADTEGEAEQLAATTAQQAADPGDEPDEADDEGDDAAIAAAAAEAGGNEPTFGKSFEVVGDDGLKHEAVDATALVKSIMERQTATDGLLAKALESVNATMQKQSEMIKSLSAQVQAVSSQGRGRKAVLNVSEKPSIDVLAKSAGGEQPGMTPDVFMAKANSAFDTGRISGKDLNVVSVCLRGNHTIDPALVQKIISA